MRYEKCKGTLTCRSSEVGGFPAFIFDVFCKDWGCFRATSSHSLFDSVATLTTVLCFAIFRLPDASSLIRKFTGNFYNRSDFF